MVSEPTHPLLSRLPDSPVAVRDGQPITLAQFLGDVERIGQLLPEGRPILNLVEDRYRFMAAFCATLTRNGCNLLPPNPGRAVQASMASEHQRLLVLHDGHSIAEGLDAVEIPRVSDWTPANDIPDIPAGHRASISYTSGSTGASSPIPKSWNMLVKGAWLNRANILAGLEGLHGLVATVPAQHMYGLELTVLLPLVGEVAIHPGRPVYPADVSVALEAMPAPRILVTTPIHLQALVDSGLRFPSVQRIISATAPLNAELAQRVEACFGAPLLDVYGCSEVGCIASREVARIDSWSPFSAFQFRQQDNDFTVVDAAHQDEPVTLQDRLVFSPDGRFSLAGRLGDIVNIGGKRGSLSEISELLRKAPGVTDGQVFEPDDGKVNSRLAGLYTGPATPAEVRGFMREWLDPVLVPRPLLSVPELPRNETGKLPRQALLDALKVARKD